MFQARGSDELILIDASTMGSAPGTLREVSRAEIAANTRFSCAMHEFRWYHALGAGNVILEETFPGPERITVLLIEPASTLFGSTLSEDALDGADQAMRRILEAIAARSEGGLDESLESSLLIERGNVLLPARVHEEYLDGRDSATAFVRAADNHLVLKPTFRECAGIELRRHNERGDRVAALSGLLREHGWGELRTFTAHATWEWTLGALALALPARHS